MGAISPRVCTSLFSLGGQCMLDCKIVRPLRKKVLSWAARGMLHFTFSSSQVTSVNISLTLLSYSIVSTRFICSLTRAISPTCVINNLNLSWSAYDRWYLYVDVSIWWTHNPRLISQTKLTPTHDGEQCPTFQFESAVPETVIKGRDKLLHPTYILYTVGCNYLSLPLQWIEMSL